MTAAYATPVTGRWPARPTIYRGVKMRSRTEANVAAFLDALDASWTYEPICFADESGQYLPDFSFATNEGTRVYAEVKPAALLDLEAVQNQMEIIWSSERECFLTIITVDNDGTPELAWIGDPVTRGWRTLTDYMSRTD